jgi:putative FmdB family regulatory protein
VTYEYNCAQCQTSFDVMKPVKDMEREEKCATCETVAVRRFVPSRVYFIGTKVQHAEYNPGLGCVVKNAEHRSELAKRRDLVEIGNDFKAPDTIHKKFDQEREAKREASYDQVMKEIV